MTYLVLRPGAGREMTRPRMNSFIRPLSLKLGGAFLRERKPRVKQVKVHGELQEHTAGRNHKGPERGRGVPRSPRAAAARREGMPADDRLQKRNDSLVRLSDSDDPRALGSP